MEKMLEVLALDIKLLEMEAALGYFDMPLLQEVEDYDKAIQD